MKLEIVGNHLENEDMSEFFRWNWNEVFKKDSNSVFELSFLVILILEFWSETCQFYLLTTCHH